MLPWAFGAAHLVAGEGKQAQASSLVMIGSGLLRPALGPLIVGMVSDAVTAAQVANGLGLRAAGRPDRERPDRHRLADRKQAHRRFAGKTVTFVSSDRPTTGARESPSRPHRSQTNHSY
jgi:hypothetical protein